jgi:Tol biopolymer transport system component
VNQAPSTSGKVEFWSANIDGSDPRREFIDSLHSGQIGSFSYAPDGKKIAWVRSFLEGYSEIVIHNLETGQELTVTSDKKIADEPAWVRGDQIIYTSDKSGVNNLWMVSSSGGTPVQVTRESTPVSSCRCSTDGQRLIYAKQGVITNDFWIVDIVKNHPKQISLREEDQHSPTFSPDGKEIAFIVGGFLAGPSASNTSSHLYIMDRDGNNRKQLSFGDEFVFGLSWSPDGRYLAYGSKKISEPADSFRAYVIEPSNPRSPKYVIHGIPDGPWLDSVRLQIFVNNDIYVTSVEGAPLSKVYDDSTHAFFIQGGSTFCSMIFATEEIPEFGLSTERSHVMCSEKQHDRYPDFLIVS